MDYLYHITVLICLYGVLALGQNLLLGIGNMLFVAQAAAFAIGAYVLALSALKAIPGYLGLLLGSAVAVTLLVPLASVAIRLKGDYLLVASLALCEVVRSTLNNTPTLTGGAQGLMAIPPLKIFRFQLSLPLHYAFASILLLITVSWIYHLVRFSPYGRLLQATGEDQDAARALGRSVRQVRVAAVTAAVISAALAGGLYAPYLVYIDPTQFTIWESVLVLAMVILGGLGSIRGSIAGVSVFILIPEISRFAGLPAGIAAPLRQIAFGFLLLLILRVRPSGIFGKSDRPWLTY